MSTWINHASVTWIQLFAIKVVKHGRVPQHIAFIMDGNRRYARRNNVERSVGHERGFHKLTEALKWCLDLGVREVTVYAFSIENLKRSRDEVDTLMDIARDKFRRLLEEVDEMNAWGIRVRVAGRLGLLGAELRALAARAALRTRHNTQLQLNIAYAYTGRDEIAGAVSELESAARRGELDAGELDEELVSAACQLSEPQLLIRTSGEVRLSDFMLWQVSDTVLYFTDVLWPELTLWHLLLAVLHYQRRAPPARAAPPRPWSPRQTQFLQSLEARRWSTLERYAAVEC